jgi:hypothetical protein
LRDRLARLRNERTHRSLADEIDDIGRYCAVLAILQDEPERRRFAESIEAADTRWMSAAT